MIYPADDEGYSCAVREDRWRIVDRYGRAQEDYEPMDDGDAARGIADALNAGVIARRVGGRIATPAKKRTKPIAVVAKSTFADDLAALGLF